MQIKTCIFCGQPAQNGCDGVCVPCLLAQGKQYEKTGNIKAFIGDPGREVCPHS